MTTDSDGLLDGPVRPVIDEDLVDRLMAQVDSEGLELLGPEGILIPPASVVRGSRTSNIERDGRNAARPLRSTILDQ